MSNVLVTAPSVEPVSLSEAKAFLRLEVDADDDFIGELISAAREYVEYKAQIALINQTWKVSLDRIPGTGGEEEWWDGVREGSIAMLRKVASYIELPIYPLVSVTSFSSYDEGDTASLFTDFYTDVSARPGRVVLRNGSVWPIASRGVNNFEIVYLAGFGATASTVPADLKIAIKQIVSHWYENREILSFDAAGRDVPITAMNVIKNRKVIRL